MGYMLTAVCPYAGSYQAVFSMPWVAALEIYRCRRRLKADEERRMYVSVANAISTCFSKEKSKYPEQLQNIIGQPFKTETEKIDYSKEYSKLAALVGS